MAEFFKDGVPVEYNPDWSWQEAALEERTVKNAKDWTQEAGVGAGKSLFSAKCVRADIDAKISAAGIWFAPTVGIRDGFIEEALKVGLELTPDWNPNKTRNLPDGFHGAVFTYQVAKDIALSLRDFMLKVKTTSVYDEWHHIFEPEGEGSTWYNPITMLMKISARTVRMSGTMFRTYGKLADMQTDADGFCISHNVFPYRMGIAADINRGVSFPLYDRTQVYERSDGSTYEYNFENAKAREFANKLLNDSLRNEDFVFNMLSQAKIELDDYWRRHPRGIPDLKRLLNHPDGAYFHPAALVIAIDIEHAKWICDLLRKLGEDPLLVHSDDITSHKNLKLFKRSERRWIVSVGMVTEGVNIPRIAVIVWLSNVTAAMKIIQGIGRSVRRIGPFDDMASALFPNDPRFGKICKVFEEDHKFALKEKEEPKEPKNSTPPTTKQIEALKKLGVSEADMPTTKYAAKKMIEELTGEKKEPDKLVSDTFSLSETVCKGQSIEGEEDILCRDYVRAKNIPMDPRKFYLQVFHYWSPEMKEVAKKEVEAWKTANKKASEANPTKKSRYERLCEKRDEIEALVKKLVYDRLTPGERNMPDDSDEKKEVIRNKKININTFLKEKFGDRDKLFDEGKENIIDEIIKYLKGEFNKNKKEEHRV